MDPKYERKTYPSSHLRKSGSSSSGGESPHSPKRDVPQHFTVKCPNCTMTFRKVGECYQHFVETEHGGKTCLKCGKVCVTWNQAIQHTQEEGHSSWKGTIYSFDNLKDQEEVSPEAERIAIETITKILEKNHGEMKTSELGQAFVHRTGKSWRKMLGSPIYQLIVQHPDLFELSNAGQSLRLVKYDKRSEVSSSKRQASSSPPHSSNESANYSHPTAGYYELPNQQHGYNTRTYGRVTSKGQDYVFSTRLMDSINNPSMVNYVMEWRLRQGENQEELKNELIQLMEKIPDLPTFLLIFMNEGFMHGRDYLLETFMPILLKGMMALPYPLSEIQRERAREFLNHCRLSSELTRNFIKAFQLDEPNTGTSWKTNSTDSFSSEMDVTERVKKSTNLRNSQDLLRNSSDGHNNSRPLSQSYDSIQGSDNDDRYLIELYKEEELPKKEKQEEKQEKKTAGSKKRNKRDREQQSGDSSSRKKKAATSSNTEGAPLMLKITKKEKVDMPTSPVSFPVVKEAESSLTSMDVQVDEKEILGARENIANQEHEVQELEKVIAQYHKATEQVEEAKLVVQQKIDVCRIKATMIRKQMTTFQEAQKKLKAQEQELQLEIQKTEQLFKQESENLNILKKNLDIERKKLVELEVEESIQ